MKTIKLSKRRAISPVIATVILVAVAITVAVGVSYWMSGIAGQYTAFEKIEISTGYSEKMETAGVFDGWQVTLELKNSGSETASLTRVFINDIAILDTNYGQATPSWVAGGLATSLLYDGTTVESGNTVTVLIYIDDTFGTLSSGTTLNVKIHSAGGMDYIKLIKLV